MKLKLERRRLALLGGGLLAAALLAAGCGGGDQAETFIAKRVVAFGDETSVIEDFRGDANGRKYTVNATVSATDPTLSCRLNPLWIQAVAARYGLVFPQCNPGPGPAAAPTSRIRAVAGARAAGLAAQVDAQLAESALTSGDLVTVLVGQNDVVAEYLTYPGVGEAQLIARLEAAGKLVGNQVNRIAATGAKVLVSTIPDLGYTPYGTAERLAHPGVDRAVLLTRLSQRFNASMRATIVNDGRMVGLLLADEQFGAIVSLNGGTEFSNAVRGACDLTRSTVTSPSLRDCTTLTLVSGATGDRWLWADDLHLSAGGHRVLGSLAVGRATNNPF